MNPVSHDAMRVSILKSMKRTWGWTAWTARASRRAEMRAVSSLRVPATRSFPLG
eukprot:CAMPEP_0183356808 /NCGR_PEP_ID=MMETSP0164_2-20130417/45207_1 /TAXON_ID=221442 /ORGANISM="Coccolithus pelagicus ssp braarudi, Strain PLY182g" /LENGTH=53 /DNA_ID=CAMNT_0025530309 /DNA_START=535 /DNA_END=696 /DNA_ORIENTATION=-